MPLEICKKKRKTHTQAHTRTHACTHTHTITLTKILILQSWSALHKVIFRLLNHCNKITVRPGDPPFSQVSSSSLFSFLFRRQTLVCMYTRASMNAYMCMHACVCMCPYMCVCMCVCMRVCIYKYACQSKNNFMSMRSRGDSLLVCVGRCVCVCVCVCACAHVHMQVKVCTISCP